MPIAELRSVIARSELIQGKLNGEGSAFFTGGCDINLTAVGGRDQIGVGGAQTGAAFFFFARVEFFKEGGELVLWNGFAPVMDADDGLVVVV